MDSLMGDPQTTCDFLGQLAQRVAPLAQQQVGDELQPGDVSVISPDCNWVVGAGLSGNVV